MWGYLKKKIENRASPRKPCFTAQRKGETATGTENKLNKLKPYHKGALWGPGGGKLVGFFYGEVCRSRAPGIAHPHSLFWIAYLVGFFHGDIS